MLRDLRDQDGPPQPLRHPPVVPLPVSPSHSPGGALSAPCRLCGCPTLGHKELRSGQAVFATCHVLTRLFPLQPDVHPGNCWAFQGPQGFAVVRLSARIRPTAVTLEHVPKSLSPNSTISSAPKDFAIFVSIPPGGWGSLWRTEVILWLAGRA